MKKIITLLLCLLFIPCMAFASIHNGDYECGYYTEIWGDVHQVSSWDKHLIMPSFELVQQTKERYYTGPFYYEYVDKYNTYYRISFFTKLLSKDDSFNFDKSRTIQSRIGNKNYTILFDRINLNKKELFVEAKAKISERYMMTLFDELVNNSSASVSFSVPLKDGKTCNIIYSANEIKELLEGVTYFLRSQ